MKSFCIIGLGKFGTSLAESLAAEGKQVMVVDIDAERINALADKVNHAVIGDPTNETVLRDSGILDYDCVVVCMVKDINANVLLTIMLKEAGVKKVVARASNDGHRHVLERIGADMIVFPERDMGEKLGSLLSRQHVSDFIEFHGYQIVELSVPKSWEGKDLITLNIRKKYGINILAVNDAEGNVIVSPLPTRCFAHGDRVSVIGSNKEIDKLIAVLH